LGDALLKIAASATAVETTADKGVDQGFGDQVVGAECQLLALIGRCALADVVARAKGLPMPSNTRIFNLIVDGRCAGRRQCPPKDKGEAQHALFALIGKIRPPVAIIAVRGHGARKVGHESRWWPNRKDDRDLRVIFLGTFQASTPGAGQAEGKDAASGSHRPWGAQICLLAYSDLNRFMSIRGPRRPQPVKSHSQTFLGSVCTEFQQHVQASDARRAKPRFDTILCPSNFLAATNKARFFTAAPTTMPVPCWSYVENGGMFIRFAAECVPRLKSRGP